MSNTTISLKNIFGNVQAIDLTEFCKDWPKKTLIDSERSPSRFRLNKKVVSPGHDANSYISERSQLTTLWSPSYRFEKG